MIDRRGFAQQLFCSLALVRVAHGAARETYSEVVSSVLITKDGKKLVVMTDRFHYTFDASPALLRTLKGSFHQYVTARFSDFHVSPNGRIIGLTTLTVAEAPDEAL